MGEIARDDGDDRDGAVIACAMPLAKQEIAQEPQADVTVVSAAVPVNPLTRMAADHHPVVGDVTLPGSHGTGR